MEADAISTTCRTKILILHLDVTDHPDIRELQALVDTGDVKPLLGKLNVTNASVIRAWSAEMREDDPRAKHILDLGLGVRSYNCLLRAGIETVGDLLVKTEREIAAIPNLGATSLEEIKETLDVRGLRLTPSPHHY